MSVELKIIIVADYLLQYACIFSILSTPKIDDKKPRFLDIINHEI